MGGGGGLGGLGRLGGIALLMPLALGGLPFFFIPGRGGLCAENAGVGMFLMGVPGEVERELGKDLADARGAIEESRSLDGIFDCEPLDCRWYVYRKQPR